MGLRSRAGIVLALSTWIACGSKDDKPTESPPPTPAGVDLDTRCVQLGKICGDKGKHVDKIVDGCKLAAKKQIEKGCVNFATAVYDCYEKELCGAAEKVWAIEDLDVLSERHGKCTDQRSALRNCIAK